MKPPSPSRLVAIDAQTFIKGIVKVPDLCDAMREDEAGVQKIIDGYNEYSGHDHVTVDLLRTSSDVQERVYFWLRGNGLRESRTAEKAIAKTKKIETAVRSANAIVTGTQTRDE